MPLVRVTVTLPPELVATADRVADGRGLSRSALLAEALEKHLLTPTQETRAGRVAEPAAVVYVDGLPNESLLDELGRRLGVVPPNARDVSSPLSTAPRIRFDRERLAGVCRRHHVAKLSLFGSVLTDAFGPDSDVDVLVAVRARSHAWPGDRRPRGRTVRRLRRATSGPRHRAVAPPPDPRAGPRECGAPVCRIATAAYLAHMLDTARKAASRGSLPHFRSSRPTRTSISPAYTSCKWSGKPPLASPPGLARATPTYPGARLPASDTASCITISPQTSRSCGR